MNNLEEYASDLALLVNSLSSYHHNEDAVEVLLKEIEQVCYNILRQAGGHCGQSR